MLLRKDRYTTDAYGRSANPRYEALDNLDEEGLAINWAARSYGKYFEGYCERKVKVGKREKIVREYKGIVYHRQLTGNQDKQIRILFAFLIAAAMALLIAASCIYVGSNSCWYVVMSMFVCAVLYVRVFLSLHVYFWASQDMTVYEFLHGAKPLVFRTRMAMGSIVFPIFLIIIMFITGEQVSLPGEILKSGVMLLSALCIWVIGMVESKVRYEQKIVLDTQFEKSESTIPERSVADDVTSN